MQYRIFRCLSSKRKYLDSSAHRAENLDPKWSKSEKNESAKNGKLSFVSFTASNQQELHSLLYNKYSYHSIIFSASPDQYHLCSIFLISKISKYEFSSTLTMDTTQSSGTLAIISEQQISPYMELVLLKSIPSNPGTILAFKKQFHFDITNLVAKCYTEVSPEYGSKKRTEKSRNSFHPRAGIHWSLCHLEYYISYCKGDTTRCKEVST